MTRRSAYPRPTDAELEILRVTRDDSTRAHVYEASQSEEQAQRGLVTHLLDRAFGGSAQQLVLRALTVKQASPEELAQIRRLLDELEGGGS